MTDSTPKIVVDLADAVSEKLGRPSFYRKVRNRDEWYVYDPVFSFIQRGVRKEDSTGYRVGYHLNVLHSEIWFILVHSPVMAQLFKRNLVFSSLIEVIQSTANFRHNHLLYRDSKQSALKGGKKEWVESNSATDFISQINEFDQKYGFVKDLFPKLPNTGKGGGTAPYAGNTFYLLLADKERILKSQLNIKELVDCSWALFLCLYPVKPIEKRSAALARNLKVLKIPKCCEFTSIQLPEGVNISPLCRGEIQGAHIKPHALGGSDRPENGLWLCDFHHRVTEGKLKGKREGFILDVHFIDKIRN